MEDKEHIHELELDNGFRCKCGFSTSGKGESQPANTGAGHPQLAAAIKDRSSALMRLKELSRHSATKDAEISELKKQVEVLTDALVRLRDCDWVITPNDRMDAVRDIARTAIKNAELKKELGK